MSKQTKLNHRLNELVLLGLPFLLNIVAESCDFDPTDLSRWELVVRILCAESEDGYVRDLISSLDDSPINRDLRAACVTIIGNCPEPIDITDPENYRQYVDARGYVSYDCRFGVVSYPVEVLRTGAEPGKSTGWWSRDGEEATHFKMDDYHIKPALDARVTLISFPDL